MTVYFIIIVIYLSFMLDLIIWRIPSEASTYSLVTEEKRKSVSSKIIWILILIVVLGFYISPLLISIIALIKGRTLELDLLIISGILISFIGRFVSLTATSALRGSKEILVNHSLYRFSRNPITLGMHFTIGGILFVFFNWFLFIGFILYLLNFHFKIKIEERYLQAKYGTLYSTYCSTTPRYILI